MKDIDSPTGIDLRPDPPRAVRLSKRAGVIALVVVTIVVGLVGYGIASRRQRTASAAERSDPRNLTAASDAGKVIAAEVPVGVMTASRPGSSGPDQSLVPPEPNPGAGAPPVRSVANPVHYYPQQPATRELSPEERMRLAAYRQEMEAMAAPTRTGAGTGVARSDPTGLPSRENDLAQIASLLQAVQGPTTRGVSVELNGARGTSRPTVDGSDNSEQEPPRRDAPREKYLKSSRERPLSKYEIKAGWDIPAILEQSLNSDLPGEIRALVRENLYDTATGKYLLVPQGSRLVGSYDSKIAYGQNGLTVAWYRIIFPDASSIDLDGMPGQDAHGNAGLRHDVDNHYRRLVGFAALTSMFSAAFQLSQSRRGGLLAYPSATETAGSAVGQELSRLGADITRRNLNVQPTIKVPVGYRFNVRVNRDLLFDAPYRPFRF